MGGKTGNIFLSPSADVFFGEKPGGLPVDFLGTSTAGVDVAIVLVAVVVIDLELFFELDVADLTSFVLSCKKKMFYISKSLLNRLHYYFS